MSEIKLKPCPFCGGKADLYLDGRGLYVVQCDYCGNRTICCQTKEGAVGAWNRRKDEDVVRCKDCIYREQADGDYGNCYYCALTKCDVGENDYCGQAERSDQ